MKNILVLLCHPDIENSQINKSIAAHLNEKDNVTLVDLYKEYSNTEINVKQEQQRLIEHDVIIFLFPFFWYSTPPLLKAWQDNVFEYGFAYGSKGNKLHGKIFFNIISTGSSFERYNNENGKIDDFLIPLHAAITDTGMKIKSPIVLYNARTVMDENRLIPHLNNIDKQLLTLG